MNRKSLLVVSLLAAQALALDAQAQGLTNPILAPIQKGSTRIQLHEIAAGLTAPNYLTHAGDGTDRLFVLDQAGTVRLIKNSQLTPQPFLDVTSRLPTLGAFGPGTFDERGLLGLAFHPDFGTPGTTGFGKLYTFNSAENLVEATRPLLVVEYTAVPLPPALALMAGGLLVLTGRARRRHLSPGPHGPARPTQHPHHGRPSVARTIDSEVTP